MNEFQHDQEPTDQNLGRKSWSNPRLTALDIQNTAGGLFTFLEGSSTHS